MSGRSYVVRASDDVIEQLRIGSDKRFKVENTLFLKYFYFMFILKLVGTYFRRYRWYLGVACVLETHLQAPGTFRLLAG